MTQCLGINDNERICFERQSVFGTYTVQNVTWTTVGDQKRDIRNTVYPSNRKWVNRFDFWSVIKDCEE